MGYRQENELSVVSPHFPDGTPKKSYDFKSDIK